MTNNKNKIKELYHLSNIIILKKKPKQIFEMIIKEENALQIKKKTEETPFLF